MAIIQATASLPRRVKTGGRRAGTPNKATRAFRESVAILLDENRDNLARWLAQVAEGDPAAGRPPDPARALDLISKLAEYAAPKLGRVEHIGDAAGPLVTTIEIEFVDAPPRAALASDMVMQLPAPPLSS